MCALLVVPILSGLFHLPQLPSGFSSGLRDCFHSCLDFLVQDMGIARRRFDVSVIQGALHKLEVGCLPQEFGPEVVAKVMEAEASHLCPFPQATPRGLGVGRLMAPSST
jgi:hypothetical protein